MQQIRTFVAIPLGRNIAQAMARLMTQQQSPGDGIKWIPQENLHLTLKFLGDVDNVDLPKICRVAEESVREIEPFTLTIAGTGGMPSAERARSLYAGIDDPTGSLVKIVGGMERGYADLGFKPEPRDYVPHLTLGRTRGGSRRASPDVVERWLTHRDKVFGEMSVDAVRIIGSFLDKDGPSYQTMNTIDLG